MIISMEDSPTKVILDLFARYEQYAQQFNFRAVVRLYGKKLVAAGPQGIAFHSNNLFTRWQYSKAMQAHWIRAGLTSIRIISMRELPVSDQFSMVTVTWSATFRKTHEQPLEFHISYLVRKTKRGAEIVLFIAHENENKILEGYGIIN